MKAASRGRGGEWSRGSGSGSPEILLLAIKSELRTAPSPDPLFEPNKNGTFGTRTAFFPVPRQATTKKGTRLLH